MSRLKRWLNMNRKKFNSDGTLKDEVRANILSRGIMEGAINSYVRRMQEDYNHLKYLDETDPEPWIVYTAYDFFTAEEKHQFNPDGSLKPEYIQEAKKIGITEQWLEEMVRRKQIDIDNYNAVSAAHEQQGINFGEQLHRELVANRKTYGQRRIQMRRDLANFEDRDSLPFDADTAF